MCIRDRCCTTDNVLVPVSTQETPIFCTGEFMSRPALHVASGRTDIPRSCGPETEPVLSLICLSRPFCPAELTGKPDFTIGGSVRCVLNDPEVKPVSPSDDEDEPSSSDPSQMLSIRGQLPESRRRDVTATGDAILFPVCLTGAGRTKTSAGSTSDAGLTKTDLSTRIICRTRRNLIEIV